MYSNAGCYEPQHVTDLESAVIHADDADLPLCTHRREGGVRENVTVEVVFQDLEDRIVKWIDSFDVIVGCVAWLTNRAILEALARRQGVAIIVQKEDWLRPDSGGWTKDLLQNLYANLKSADRWQLGMGHYSDHGDPELPPVMCAGLAPIKKQPALPRMHHKFLVGCKLGNEMREVPKYIWEGNAIVGTKMVKELVGPVTIGQEVWTGSFNLTDNATKSLENAVILKDETLAAWYLNEARTLYGIAEPLQWNSRWVQPEFRIGT